MLGSSRAVGIVAVFGIVFDLLLNGQRPGLGLSLVALAAVATAASVARPSRERDAFLLAAAALGPWPAMHANDALLALDAAAFSALLGLAVTAGERPFLSSSFAAIVWRLLGTGAAALTLPRAFFGALARIPARRLGRALRTLAIVVPIVLAFVVLLASADRVFGELVTPVLPDLSGALGHAALIAAGCALAAILALTAARGAPEWMGDGTTARVLGSTEWISLLATLDLLFATFVGVQIAVLFGGRERVEVTPGLTYAEYARSGFFQLIAVAALTGFVILGAWDLGRRESAREERRFRVLVSVMVALTGVILASALTRLALYEDAFGFTTSRLGAYVAIAYIALGLAILLAAIWSGRRRTLVPLLVVAALATLLATNALNPERFVAARNAERFRARHTIDAVYLARLGPDAVPVAVDLLDELPRRDAAFLRDALCLRGARLLPHGGWRSLNAGRAGALDALRRAGIDPGRCGRGDHFPREPGA